MNKKNCEKIIDNDLKIKSSINNILTTDSIKTIQLEIKELDKYLFDNFCLKKYLKNCEPEFCIYRINGECKYVDMSKYLNNEKRLV